MKRIDQIKELLKEDPNDPFLSYAMACELEKENEIQEAIEWLEKIRSTSPNYYGLYYKLGGLYEALGNPEAAKNIYEEGVIVCSELKEDKIKSELLQALSLMD